MINLWLAPIAVSWPSMPSSSEEYLSMWGVVKKRRIGKFSLKYKYIWSTNHKVPHHPPGIFRLIQIQKRFSLIKEQVQSKNLSHTYGVFIFFSLSKIEKDWKFMLEMCVKTHFSADLWVWLLRRIVKKGKEEPKNVCLWERLSSQSIIFAWSINVNNDMAFFGGNCKSHQHHPGSPITPPNSAVHKADFHKILYVNNFLDYIGLFRL